MHELRAAIHPDDRERIEWLLFEGEDEHSWIMHDDTKTYEMSVQGIFESADAALDAWDTLKAGLGFPQEPTVRELQDEDWKESYKEHFHPWSIGPVHWVPEWLRESYELPEGHQAVWLDPGLAFGTGNHGTTRLCVEQLLAFREQCPDPTVASVVDAGCGSGILAISAIKLGFQNVRAFDNDPDAVRIACENAQSNQVADTLFDVGDLTSGFSEKPSDCVMANILANVLMDYSQQLVDAVAPGGWLILSGILAEEAEQVAQHFAKHKELSSPSFSYMDEWACIRFVMRGE